MHVKARIGDGYKLFMASEIVFLLVRSIMNIIPIKIEAILIAGRSYLKLGLVLDQYSQYHHIYKITNVRLSVRNGSGHR